MSNKFIISTDNCADYFKSYMEQNKIYCVPLKRILDGKEFAEVYDSEAEFEAFYDELKKGARPTTSQINSSEAFEHFNRLLEQEGDIIHVSLSSGLSGSYNSALFAAEEINKTLKGRKIYVFDSLHVTAGMMMIIDKLMELRQNTTAEEAIKIIEKICDHLHIFFLVDDLFNLRRGGRLSASKAIMGTILRIKPILTVNKEGQVAIENKIKGNTKALNYLLEQTVKHAGIPNEDYAGKTLYTIRSSKNELYPKFKNMLQEKYPKAIIKEVILGPIIGTHVGSGAVAVLFEGNPRLDITKG